MAGLTKEGEEKLILEILGELEKLSNGTLLIGLLDLVRGELAGSLSVPGQVAEAAEMVVLFNKRTKNASGHLRRWIILKSLSITLDDAMKALYGEDVIQ